MLRKPRVVFFDVGNTLLFPNHDIILAPLRAKAEAPSEELWHSIERRTKPQFDAEMQSGHADHSFWYLFYCNLLEEMGLHDDMLRDQLVAATRVSANWGKPRAETRAHLDRISQHYRVGVISNSDGKIPELLAANGIFDCFESIIDSGNIGYEKPHPAIFEVALRGMKTAPEESLYVGDMYSIDYQGATRVGMQAMLFDVSGAYRDLGVPRVDSLQALDDHLKTLS